MTQRCRLLVIIGSLAALCAFFCPLFVRAERVVDPKAPLSWQEMKSCQLVVLARHVKHVGSKEIHLKVERVLKGANIKPGNILKVNLLHWYSIHTRAVGMFAMTEEKSRPKPDGVPRLCYQQQMMNPGPLVPCEIVPDARKPRVYFFPNGPSPQLERRGQVQPTLFAEGWQQVLDGKRPNLLFRLTATVPERMRADAEEEFLRRRDPVIISKFCQWLTTPPVEQPNLHYRVRELLPVVGDRNGDIYNLVRKRFLDKSAGKDIYLNWLLGEQMGRLNQRRALSDFNQLLAKGSLNEKQRAAQLLGCVGNVHALNRIIELLEDPKLAQQAESSLALVLGYSFHRQHRTTRQSAELDAIGEKKLTALLKSDKISDKQRTSLRQRFAHLLFEPYVIDAAKASKILLDPDQPCYHGRAEGAAYILYPKIREAYDPNLIPLLLQVLREVPAARTGKALRLAETLAQYAWLCPNAFKREFLKTGSDKLLLQQGDKLDYRYRRLLAKLDIPYNLDRRFHDQHGAMRKKLFTPAMLKSMQKNYVDWWPNAAYLEMLLQVDLALGQMQLKKSLENIDVAPPHARRDLPVLAARYGDRDYAAKLLPRNELPPLIPTADAKYLQRYLKILDGKKRIIRRYSVYLDQEYIKGLQNLFPNYADAYFARVSSLLRSDEIIHRQTGIQLLQREFDWQFDFHADAPPTLRKSQLEKLQSLLDDFCKLDCAGMHAHLLRELGVALPGQLSPEWLPQLKKAALSYHPAIAGNALQLIAMLIYDDDCFMLRSISPPQRRKKALAVFFRDRTGANKETPLSKQQLEDSWRDLASMDMDVGYRAMRELIAAPRSTMQMLRHRLKPPAPLPPKQISRAIADLGAPSFRVRAKAMQQLSDWGARAESHLQTARAKPPSLEVRLRVEKLLQKLQEWSPQRLRLTRAIDVLEHLRGWEARLFLEELSRHEVDCRLTHAAKFALQRRLRGI